MLGAQCREWERSSDNTKLEVVYNLRMEGRKSITGSKRRWVFIEPILRAKPPRGIMSHEKLRTSSILVDI